MCADGQRIVVLLNGRSVHDSLGLPAAGGTVELRLSAALGADALRHLMLLGAREH